MRDLIEELNEATKAYDEGKPIMSDKEWDNKYFELKQMEETSGITYSDSPTQKIIYEVSSGLNKVKHNHPMLSLAKTKDVEELKKFIEKYPSAGCVGMLKMDGLTCSLKYLNGKLISAETRGDGEEGEDITHNAKVVKNIPKTIEYKGELIVDGEIICKKSDFEEFADQYRNPRNFASGSIRLLDSRESANRNLSFIAWDMITDLFNTLVMKLDALDRWGFEVVPWTTYNKDLNLEDDIIKWLRSQADNFPIDGLVFKYDDCKTYKDLGYTDHHFNGGLAFKFYDETYTTYLRRFDWDVSRTGKLTPVAIFDPVDINGSTVSRASVHNLTMMEEVLGTPYEGQEIEVFKANEIIPQIYSSVKKDNPEGIISLPTKCPLCGSVLTKKKDGVAETLNCSNDACKGKVLNKLNHFLNCLGVDGIAKATLESFYDRLGVKTFRDLFQITPELLSVLPNFGETSINNVMKSLNDIKEVTLTKLISALGIPTIGTKQASQIAEVCTNWTDFRNKAFSDFDWTIIDGFGEIKSKNVNTFDYSEADAVEPYLTVVNKSVELMSGKLFGKKIVITGKLINFNNRNELVSLIKKNGGEVQDGIKKDTSWLVNNDITSNSSKNKKAKELGIQIISEQELLSLLEDK